MHIPKTVVITCAGIGSRLGLGHTKSLIEISGRPIIHWQLDMLKEVEDVRIVVGFEADRLIEVVRQVRNDILFIYNHDYFNTKTLASLYLGAQYGHDLVFSIDGDLLVHPDDMKRLLAMSEEFIGFTKKTSEEPVYVRLDDKEHVISFTRRSGEYEWLGPACLRREHLAAHKKLHVYQHIASFLPIRGVCVRAMDIDTMRDFSKAKLFLKNSVGRR